MPARSSPAANAAGAAAGMSVGDATVLVPAKPNGAAKASERATASVAGRNLEFIGLSLFENVDQTGTSVPGAAARAAPTKMRGSAGTGSAGPVAERPLGGQLALASVGATTPRGYNTPGLEHPGATSPCVRAGSHHRRRRS